MKQRQDSPPGLEVTATGPASGDTVLRNDGGWACNSNRRGLTLLAQPSRAFGGSPVHWLKHRMALNEPGRPDPESREAPPRVAAARQGFPREGPREPRTLAADSPQPPSATCPAQAPSALGLTLLSKREL